MSSDVVFDVYIGKRVTRTDGGLEKKACWRKQPNCEYVRAEKERGTSCQKNKNAR